MQGFPRIKQDAIYVPPEVHADVPYRSLQPEVLDDTTGGGRRIDTR